MEPRMLTGEDLMTQAAAQAAEDYLTRRKKKPKKTTFLGKPIKYPELDPTIRDREDDWLTQQLKDEAEAYKRVCDMFGIIPHVSDAKVLKVEHAIEHGYQKMTQAYR